MKANEAPEKIFLEWYRVGDEKYRDWVITPKTNNEPIQYTRTDAFLEKAEKFLTKFVLCEYTEIDRDGCLFDYERFAEDFKNYMKGE